MWAIWGYGFSKLLNIAGPLLWIIVYLLILANIFIYVMGLFPIIYLLNGMLFSWTSIVFGGYLAISLWFNHSMGMWIKPGCLEDYYFPEETKEERDMRIQDINKLKNIKIISSDMKKLMQFAHPEFNSIQKYISKKCEKCKFLKNRDAKSEDFPGKPLRFHHWSIWGNWVMNMDHHCPWFNNWIGIQNLRYFLLFLFHLWISCIYMLYNIYSWNGYPLYYRYGRLINLAIGLHVGLLFCIGFFWWWHWYLWLIGNFFSLNNHALGIPQLEYIQTRSDLY